MYQQQIYNPGMERKSYSRFCIPPSFELAQFHRETCRVYSNSSVKFQRCQCCSQEKGDKKISLCSKLGQLKKIGDQVPLFFMFLNLMGLLVLLMVFIEAGIFVFACDGDIGEIGDSAKTNCEYVKYPFKIENGIQATLYLGFKNKNKDDLVFMIELILYSLILLMIKTFLMKKKFDYQKKHLTIEKKSLELANLHKESTEEQIRQLFCQYRIEDIVFTFKIQEYFHTLKKAVKIQKQLRYLQSEFKDQEMLKQAEEHSHIMIKQLQAIKKRIKKANNRLSVGYVVFESVQERNKALDHFKTNLLMKLLYKLLPSCSRSSIQGQHITVSEACSPDDIYWLNLGKPYLRTKIVRFLSFFVCSSLIIFGLASELIIFTMIERNQIVQIIIACIVFFMNFVIIMFLEWTTNKIQKHSTRTGEKLNLIRKITFFMFLNISIMPFLIFLYDQVSLNQKIETSLEYLAFQVFLIGVSNSLKPLLTILSVERVIKWIKRKLEISKGENSKLNQLQANQLFEPIQFPIEVYYSLILTTLMMNFFYMSCIQVLLIIEIPAVILLYGTAKYMLLRVCKSPIGLSTKLINLAQKLLSILIPLAWIGRTLIYYFTKQGEKADFFEQTISKNVFKMVQVGIVILMLFSEGLIRFIAKKISKSPKINELYDPLALQSERRTFREANVFLKLNQEDPFNYQKQKPEIQFIPSKNYQ